MREPNMRSLKFRAWDTVDGVMWLWPAVRFFKMQEFEENTAYIFLQYIGRKDANGKEIYEEDIVRFATRIPRIEVVEWLDGAAGFDPFIDPDEQDDTCSVPKPEDCEVIGNRFENPELVPGEGEW